MYVKGIRRSNQERTETTRTALMRAARRLFVARGYAGTGTPEIAAAANMTRGALYHHFEDKRALFRAVVEAELAAVADEIERSTTAIVAPFDALIEGTNAFFRAMTVKGRTRLLLVDGPAVLSWAELYTIDEQHGTRTLRGALKAAMDAGAIRTLPLDALTALLTALFDRGALAAESGIAPADLRAVVTAIFEGLRVPQGAPPSRRGHSASSRARAR